jgi:hypothetical protein
MLEVSATFCARWLKAEGEGENYHPGITFLRAALIEGGLEQHGTEEDETSNSASRNDVDDFRRRVFGSGKSGTATAAQHYLHPGRRIAGG